MDFVNEKQKKIDICLNCTKPAKACAGCTVHRKQDKGAARAELYRNIRVLNAKGYVDREVGEKLGLSTITIQKIRNEMGLTPNGKTKHIDRVRAKAFYDLGYNDCEIARELMCSNITISNWRKKNNLPPNCTRGGKRIIHE